jgi:DnaJ-class molecular chaperone
MRFHDYYKTLSVKRDASETQIKKAYRELARKLHPDVNKNHDAEERFKALNEAYQVLSDPEKRSRYDRFGADWERYQSAHDGTPSDFSQWFSRRQQERGQTRHDLGTSGNEGFSDFFETIFGPGRGSRPRRPRMQRRGEDHEYPVQIGLREAYTGTTRMFETQSPTTCDECGGAGITDSDLCLVCGGTGSVHSRNKLEVTIPAGIRDGQRVRVAGKGGPGAGGGAHGDVYLKVQIRSDPQFTLEQSDLRTDVEVPLFTALLGGEVIVATLSGNVVLTIPPETQNGRIFRLRGKGWPTATNSTERGDLLVRVQVRLPVDLSDDERATFERLRATRMTSGSRSVA